MHTVILILCRAGLSHSIMSSFLCSTWTIQPARFLCPWGFSKQEYWTLLQGIFPTQGLNPGLMHCRWIHYYLIHQRSSRILEWVAYPFSSGTSQPRNWTGISSIAFLQFFTSWATQDTLSLTQISIYLTLGLVFPFCEAHLKNTRFFLTFPLISGWEHMDLCSEFWWHVLFTLDTHITLSNSRVNVLHIYLTCW